MMQISIWNQNLKSSTVLQGIVFKCLTKFSGLNIFVSQNFIIKMCGFFIDPNREITTSENLKQYYIITTHGSYQLPLMEEYSSRQLSPLSAYIVSLLPPWTLDRDKLTTGTLIIWCQVPLHKMFSIWFSRCINKIGHLTPVNITGTLIMVYYL